ncbi:glycosyltransferase family 2 protein [Patescibacteria group bacterium]
MAKVNELSVFFPAYNEEDNIKTTVTKALKVLPFVAKKWEVIVVNDGSTDKTAKVVNLITKKEKRVKMVTHSPNRGYGEALKSGFKNSRYELIVFNDGDGQFDFSQVTKFLKLIKSADLVVGFRLNRQDPWHRKLFGWGWTMLANLLLGIKVKDVDCGFKLLKKEVIRTIPPLESVRGGMISPELLAKAKKAHFKLAEVGVQHYPRQTGHQTGADLKVIVNSFIDLGKLWWQLR